MVCIDDYVHESHAKTSVSSEASGRKRHTEEKVRVRSEVYNYPNSPDPSKRRPTSTSPRRVPNSNRSVISDNGRGPQKRDAFCVPASISNPRRELRWRILGQIIETDAFHGDVLGLQLLSQLRQHVSTRTMLGMDSKTCIEVIDSIEQEFFP